MNNSYQGGYNISQQPGRFAHLKSLVMAHKLMALLIVGVIGLGAYGVKTFILPQPVDYSAYNTEVPTSSGQVAGVSNDSPSPTDNLSPLDTSAPLHISTPSSKPTASPSPTTTPVPATAGNPDSSHSNVAISPSSVNADGSSNIGLTITLKDSAGVPVVGATIVNVNVPGITNAYTASGSTVTNAYGQAVGQINSTTGGSGSFNVTAIYNGTTTMLTGLGSVSFTPILSLGNSSCNANPNPGTADGSTPSQIQLTLRDNSAGGGATINNQSVSLSISNSGSVSNLSSTTNGSGNISPFNLTSSAHNSTPTITVTYNGVSIVFNSCVTFN